MLLYHTHRYRIERALEQKDICSRRREESLEAILNRCIILAEEVKLSIYTRSEMPRDCLGGEMLYEYMKVQSYQSGIINKICKELREK